jgi:hypothetical protein
MRRAADVVLASRFTQPAAVAQRQTPEARQAASAVAVAANELTRLAGRYYAEELDATYELGVLNGALVSRRPRGATDTLVAVDARTFRGGGFTYRFDSSGKRFALDAGRARGLEFVRR